MTTLQAAMDELAADGFIVAAPSSGTYVADRPPHLATFALVSSHHEELVSKSFYHQAVRAAATGRGLRGDYRLQFYYDIMAPDGASAWQSLVEQIERHLIAGIIFLNTPSAEVLGAEIWGRFPVPRLAVVHSGKTLAASIPTIFHDRERLIREALELLAKQGRRRVAAIWHHDALTPEEVCFRRTAESLGLHCPPRWMQFPSCDSPQSVRHCVMQLMHGDADARPDGLLLMDENAAGPTVESLLRAGIAVPGDCRVVSHCTYPPQFDPPVAEVHWLGFDAGELLRTAIDQLRKMRGGQQVPIQPLTLPPRSPRAVERYQNGIGANR